jgi:hypothetical protein
MFGLRIGNIIEQGIVDPWLAIPVWVAPILILLQWNHANIEYINLKKAIDKEP